MVVMIVKVKGYSSCCSGSDNNNVDCSVGNKIMVMIMVTMTMVIKVIVMSHDGIC